MPVCNTTQEDETVVEETYGSAHLTFHKAGLWVSALCAIIATVIAIYLTIMHALHYSRPNEQKHIIRILFMIPVYAIVSWLSFRFYKEYIYFEVIRDCYEAFAIAAFFALMCNYCAPNVHEQKEYFRMQKPKNWVLPLNWIQRCTGGESRGILRRPGSGLTLFNIIWIGIFQYCLIRVLFTFVALITQATGRYCDTSLNPAFSHVWVQVFDALGVTVAMYCIIQFYMQIKQDIQEHKPLLKLTAIKLVIFFSFWQSFLISLASTRFHPTPKVAYMDVKVGIPSVLLTIEMACFSVLHIFAFSWKPYSLNHSSAVNAAGAGFSGMPHYEGGTLGVKAFADAANPWDIIKSSARGFRWLFVGVKNRRNDISYKDNVWSSDSGVLGGNDVYYESTKLGPVGSDGPTHMQRDRHMSRERIEDVNRRQSAERRAESEASSSTTYVAGAGKSTTGDLADVPPQEYDTAYHSAGRKAYYGHELPPAPYPPSPYDETPGGSVRGVSPLRGTDESDTAGLLSNAGHAGGRMDDGAGRHPAFRK